MNILILGDVVGRPGRKAINIYLKDLIEEYSADFVIINGENASGGNGLTVKNAQELLQNRVDAITMGNHVWQKRELLAYIEKSNKIIRPLNYPDPCPGDGYKIFQCNGKRIAVINLLGQIFLENVDSPFQKIEEIIEVLMSKADIIIVDFHAEATSEKIAFGYFLDGFATIVYGTHTHVQTADNRILDNGTAYITDIGMVGPLDGVLGIEKKLVIEKMKYKRPVRFEIAKGKIQVNGIIVEIDDNNKAKKIQRVYKIYEN
jgi:hypothetical protein